MKKEIIERGPAGLFRVTTPGERWYAIPSKDQKTGLPIYRYIPSVTWIAGCYPKGVGFYKWLAEKGWDEAEAIKSAAGDKGSKVHAAIEAWLKGELEIGFETKLMNPNSGQLEEMTIEEYEAIGSFIDWYDAVKPEIISTEMTVVNEKEGYAGTVDCVAMIDGEMYIIDFKTSQAVWPEYELQVSAYKNAIATDDFLKEHGVSEIKLGILQIGYKRNKAGWKWNEVADKYPLFVAARQIWANEHGDEKPKQKDYPMKLPSKLSLDEVEVEPAPEPTELEKEIEELIK